MKFVTLPNGNVQFQLEDSDDKLLVEELLERNGGDDVAFMSDLLEATGWQPNGRLAQVYPEDVGGLTDSPIITDEREICEDGTRIAWGQVWWFPNYQVAHFGELLRDDGKVTFQLAETVVDVDLEEPATA